MAKLGKTAKYYHTHPEANEKRLKQQTKYASSPSQVNYREELNLANHRAGTYGNGDGMDVSHKKSHKSGGTLKDGWKMEKATTNRARKEKKVAVKKNSPKNNIPINNKKKKIK